jgi:hypothetical protein
VTYRSTRWTNRFGARKIFAKILNRTEAKVFDDLLKGRFDGYVKKVGRLYVSTPRRLLASLEPTAADTGRNSAA